MATKYDWKIMITGIITLCSWLFFIFFTYGTESVIENILHFVPLGIFITQITLSVIYKSRKILVIALFNIVPVLVIIYTIKPTVNYIIGTPTVMKCCYHRASEPDFDPNKSVYLDYFDDDCDWPGLYHYTIDINNFVTNGLITLFGNHVKHETDDNLKNNE